MSLTKKPPPKPLGAEILDRLGRIEAHLATLSVRLDGLVGRARPEQRFYVGQGLAPPFAQPSPPKTEDGTNGTKQEARSVRASRRARHRQ